MGPADVLATKVNCQWSFVDVFPTGPSAPPLLLPLRLWVKPEGGKRLGKEPLAVERSGGILQAMCYESGTDVSTVWKREDFWASPLLQLCEMKVVLLFGTAPPSFLLVPWAAGEPRSWAKDLLSWDSRAPLVHCCDLGVQVHKEGYVQTAGSPNKPDAKKAA